MEWKKQEITYCLLNDINANTTPKTKHCIVALARDKLLVTDGSGSQSIARVTVSVILYVCVSVHRLKEQESYTIVETTVQCGDKSNHPNSKHNKLRKSYLYHTSHNSC